MAKTLPPPQRPALRRRTAYADINESGGYFPLFQSAQHAECESSDTAVRPGREDVRKVLLVSMHLGHQEYLPLQTYTMRELR